MGTDKKAMTIYVRHDLYELIESAALADGRSISNYVERLLDAKVPTTIPYTEAHAERDRQASKQLDIAGAIAAAVKRGPQPMQRPVFGKVVEVVERVDGEDVVCEQINVPYTTVPPARRKNNRRA